MSDTGNPSPRDAGLNCPACRVALTMSSREGIEIDYCPTCRGVWLDRGELDKIIERSLSYPAGSPNERPGTAPPPPQTAPGYGQPWDGGYGGHHGGSRHGRRRGFLGDLFD